MSTTENAQPPLIKPRNQSGPTKAWLVASFVALALAVSAFILFTFDPVQSTFYPTCVFKKITGWSCPACGCLRASHQLLHGHITTAFRLNPLFIATLPFIGLLGIEQLLHKHIIKKPPLLGWALLVIFVLFGVLRNLPPFLSWSGQ